MEYSPKAKAAALAAVKEQLKSPETPYVKEHYDRLIREGHKKEEVMKLLGLVLVVEMWEMSTRKRGFDEEKYIERLEDLPDTSWLDDE